MAERRIDLLHVPRFGKTPMVMEHIKAAMLGEPVPRFEPAPVKIDIGKIEPDPKIFEIPESPLSKSVRDWSRRFEEALLRFADRFKTRRVYVVNWSINERFKMTWYQKFFAYNDRTDAYAMARHVHGNVTWYDFKRIVDLPLEGVKQIPSPNQPLAIELWKTFNTCALCHTENRCKTVLLRGKQDRICIECLENYCNFKRR